MRRAIMQLIIIPAAIDLLLFLLKTRSEMYPKETAPRAIPMGMSKVNHILPEDSL
jgi:hypothetical protein